jgi:hypothetical protein
MPAGTSSTKVAKIISQVGKNKIPGGKIIFPS